MKTYSTIMVMVLVITSSHISHAQNDPTLEHQKEAIANLANLMKGKWEGTGWTKKGQAEPEPVHVKESVEIKNDGTTLLIQGMGTHPETKKNLHDALAIIYYNVQSETYQFDSHLSTGQHKLATGTLDNNVFIWGFELPNNASIKYTITFVDNTWQEIGEYSPSKDVWYKFFEMNLNKL